MATTITFKGKEPISCIAVLSDTALVTSADDLLKQLPRPKIDIQFDANTDINTLISVYSDSDALSEISINTQIPVTTQVTRPATEEEIAAMEAEKATDSESDITSDGTAEEDAVTDKTSTEDESSSDTTSDDTSIETDETTAEVPMITEEVTEYKEEIFVHLNYVIRIGLNLTYVDGKEIWVMSLAQLTETDIALRELSGYIAKKVNFLTFEEYQQALIDQSKEDLAKYLETHPLISNCYQGVYNKFNATEQHRNLFTTKYFAHMLKVQSGIPDQMTWNISGQECVPWTDEEALIFVMAMDAYITPLVHAQQTYELAIKAATTKEELDAIKIDYSKVETPNGTEDLLGK